MKKSLLAIAVASVLPGVVAAQVVVGGVMDGGYNMTSVKGQSASNNKAGTEVETVRSGGNASGALASNRLFFRGTEKIGDLTAGFHYELGMDAGGTGDLSTTGGVRRSVVTLGGGFGTFTIGRDYTPIFNVSAALDASAADNVNFGKAVYLNVATTRDSGQINWTSPQFSGITVNLSVAKNTVDQAAYGSTGSPNPCPAAQTTPAGQLAPSQCGTKVDQTVTGFSAVWESGPFRIMAASAVRDNSNNSSAALITDQKRMEAIFGGTWAVNKDFTLLAAYGGRWTNDSKSDLLRTTSNTARAVRFTSSNFQDSKDRTDEYVGYQLGARYMITPNTQIHGSWGKAEMQFIPSCVNSSLVGCTTQGVKKGDIDAYKLGLIQSLSKRTRLYALYGADDGRLDTDSGQKIKRSELAFGLNHAF